MTRYSLDLDICCFSDLNFPAFDGYMRGVTHKGDFSGSRPPRLAHNSIYMKRSIEPEAQEQVSTTQHLRKRIIGLGSGCFSVELACLLWFHPNLQTALDPDARKRGRVCGSLRLLESWALVITFSPHTRKPAAPNATATHLSSGGHLG